MTKEVQNELNKTLTHIFNQKSSVSDIYPLRGGSINDVFFFTFSSRKFVCKVNSGCRNKVALPLDFFEIEKKNLDFLRGKSGFKLPEVITVGTINSTQFICLEYIDSFESELNWHRAGLNLADLHTNTSAEFGLSYDNYMGTVIQKNTTKHSFIDFFVTHRLDPLVKKCYDNKLVENNNLRQFERFYSSLNSLLPPTKPSLIHGDLWIGNIILGISESTLIDPAISFSHPEADLAMSVLFGAFHPEFYAAYESKAILEKNWRERVDYFNLYPNLIHLFLFGESYKPNIVEVIKKF